MYIILALGKSTDDTANWTYEWALIVIAVLAVLAFIVVGVFCVIKRRNSSSPAKIKKAAAAASRSPQSLYYKQISPVRYVDFVRLINFENYKIETGTSKNNSLTASAVSLMTGLCNSVS